MANIYQPFDGKHLVRSFVSAYGKDENFAHTFGGPPRHNGTVFNGFDRSVHLTYCLDLSDPRLGIEIPGIRFLPLYYPFQFDPARMAYQVLSNDEVRIVQTDNPRFTPEVPAKDYPTELPFREASVDDPERVELDPVELSDFEEFYETPFDYSYEAFLVLADWLPQGPPMSVCGNPICNGVRMDFLATLSNDELDDFNLWGEYGDYVTITYEKCPQCHRIFTTNQCT